MIYASTFPTPNTPQTTKVPPNNSQHNRKQVALWSLAELNFFPSSILHYCGSYILYAQINNKIAKPSPGCGLVVSKWKMTIKVLSNNGTIVLLCVVKGGRVRLYFYCIFICCWGKKWWGSSVGTNKSLLFGKSMFMISIWLRNYRRMDSLIGGKSFGEVF